MSNVTSRLLDDKYATHKKSTTFTYYNYPQKLCRPAANSQHCGIILHVLKLYANTSYIIVIHWLVIESSTYYSYNTVYKVAKRAGPNINGSKHFKYVINRLLFNVSAMSDNIVLTYGWKQDNLFCSIFVTTFLHTLPH